MATTQQAVEKLRSQGYNDQQIEQFFVQENRQSPFQQPQQQTQPQQGNLLTNILGAVTKPATDYLGYVGESASQIGRIATNPAMRKALMFKLRLGPDLTEEEHKQVAAEPIALSKRGIKDEDIKDFGSIVRTGLKRTAGAASYAVPGGGSIPKLMLQSGIAGGLYGFGQSETGNELQDTAGGFVGGSVAGGLLGTGGKVISKVIGKSAGPVAQVGQRGTLSEKAVQDTVNQMRKAGINIDAKGVQSLLQSQVGTQQATGLRGILAGAGEKLSRTATAKTLKSTPSDYLRAAENQGIDVISTAQKYFPNITNPSQIVGTAANKFKGGQLNQILNKAEQQIQAVSQKAGSNIKLTSTGDEIVNALKAEARQIKNELGSGNRYKELMGIIKQVQGKYKNGVTVKKALETLRTGNRRFGQSVLETEGGAVATAAQKVETNVIRNILKKTFPEIAEALDTQAELLTIRPILQKSASSIATEAGKKSGIGLIDYMLGLGGFAAGGPLTSAALVGGRQAMQSPTVLGKTGQALSAVAGARLPQMNLSPQASQLLQGILGSGVGRAGAAMAQPSVTMTPQMDTYNGNNQEQIINQLTPSITPQETTQSGLGLSQNDLIMLMLADPKNASTYKTIMELTGGKEEKKTEAQVARDDVVALSDAAFADLYDPNKKIITGALANLEEMKAGPLAGYVFEGSQDTLDFNRKIQMLKASIAKARAGTSFTPNEEKLLNSYTPAIGDSRQQLETKLKGLKEFYANKSVSNVGSGEEIINSLLMSGTR